MKLLHDLCHVSITGSASKRMSKIILDAAEAVDDDPANPQKTQVMRGVLHDCGPGRMPTEEGPQVPNLFECDPVHFYPGCTVLFVSAFSRIELEGKDDHLIEEVDIMAAEDSMGNIWPAWGRVVMKADRTGGTVEKNGIFVVTQEKSLQEQEYSTGTVIAVAPDRNLKQENNGTVLKNMGVFKPSLTPGDRVVYGRFAAWRIFPAGKVTDDMVIVGQKDILCTADADAELRLYE